MDHMRKKKDDDQKAGGTSPAESSSEAQENAMKGSKSSPEQPRARQSRKPKDLDRHERKDSSSYHRDRYY